MGHYGPHHTWMDAVHAFGAEIENLDGSLPTQLWERANREFGDGHDDWARDLIQFFVHVGALECVGERQRRCRVNAYLINNDVIRELHLD